MNKLVPVKCGHTLGEFSLVFLEHMRPLIDKDIDKDKVMKHLKYKPYMIK